MVRPIKWRRIEHMPENSYYVPSDKCMDNVLTNILLIEELEAIRLKDLEGLEQSECAKKMQVSRPTFQRILISAHEKVADALVNGKAIHMYGGNYTKNVCNVQCQNCNNLWNESYENIAQIKEGKYSCPKCGSSNIECTKKCKCGMCRRKNK